MKSNLAVFTLGFFLHNQLFFFFKEKWQFMEEGGVEVKKGEPRSLLHVNTLVQAQDVEVSDPQGQRP